LKAKELSSIDRGMRKGVDKMKNSQLKCSECGGKVIKKKVDFSMYGVSLGKFDAEVCSKCGEELFDEETSKKIDESAKKKGLWGLEAQTKVGKAGDSLIIRVNKKIADFYGLKQGEEVTIAPKDKEELCIFI
jgi:hypothetical protein